MKKPTFLILVLLFSSLWLSDLAAQSIKTNQTDAIVKIESQNKGVLMPRMTQNQRNGISNVVEGLTVYQTDGEKGVYQYNGASWIAVGSNGPEYLAGDAITIDANKKIDLKITNQQSGDMFYFDGTTWVLIPKGTNGQKLCLVNGVPTWVN